LAKLNLNQDKSLGQHWLTDQDILERIKESLNGLNYDLILEVGPGKGALTHHLLKKVKSEGKHLIVVEFDERMAGHLQNQYPGSKNIKIINQDYLKFNEAELSSDSYIIIANLPYNISSPIFSKLVDAKLKPRAAALLVQKEVAQRLNSSAGQKGCSPLSIKLNNFYETELGLIVPKEAFEPPPKVTSQVIKLKLREVPILSSTELEKVLPIINFGFKFRRKKLINSLSSKFRVEDLKSVFEKNNIKLNTRAEELSLNQWHELSLAKPLNSS
jgi:16S rRNA (adenine1518-N6/adenine1519-N6)-dimethyltransferase